MAKNDPHSTPAMKQFHRFKEQHPGCVLFFRMGDFYEMFYQDAELAHQVLGVTLTQRTSGIPMAGVPHHAMEGYLRRMIAAGYRVAICDQVEDPAEAKGVVRRDVTRVVTPGTLTDEAMLEEGRESPLLAMQLIDPDFTSKSKSKSKPKSNPKSTPGKAFIAAAWAELSTGSFHVGLFGIDQAADEIARIAPGEVLAIDAEDLGEAHAPIRELCATLGSPPVLRPEWQFRAADAERLLCRQFQVKSLEAYGLDEAILGPTGAVLAYLLETQRVGDDGRLAHLQPPRRLQNHDRLIVDRASLASLEIEQTLRSGGTEGTVLGAIQAGGGCVTGPGKRRLRQWLCYPLCAIEPIEQRQDAVAGLVSDSRLLDELRDQLKGVQDVQRIAGRLGVGRLSPRDLVALARSCARAMPLSELLTDTPALRPWCEQLTACAPALAALGDRLATSCVDDPPAHLREGGLIRDGVDPELDECRGLKRDGAQWLAEYQAKLIAETDVTSLKVGYNRVFGYFIELSAVQAQKAPAEWARRQTLKNAERFVTEELKTYETKVLSADSRAIAREQVLFTALCGEVGQHFDALGTFAEAVADLDVLGCFARLAARQNYCRPEMVEAPVLQLTQARHPVLDRTLGESMVPNDVALGSGQVVKWSSGQVGTEDQRVDSESVTRPLGHSATRPLDSSTLSLITGPNMAGKSTFIRTAALITLLAHTGCFVPCDAAVVGLTDRIFTRVGASDELHAGKSTFMVEMTETANLCHHATERSLVILDEIGRGTSTLDGLSLAWAITEHLADMGCRCLFATHYHELTRLAEQRAVISNLHVKVREWQEQIIFLHKIVPGATDRSYGIHVAQIAGLPPEVVRRAKAVLADLEASGVGRTTGSAAHGVIRENVGESSPASASRLSAATSPQMSLFTEFVPHPVVKSLEELQLDRLSPMDAFDELRRLQASLNDGGTADETELD